MCTTVTTRQCNSCTRSCGVFTAGNETLQALHTTAHQQCTLLCFWRAPAILLGLALHVFQQLPIKAAEWLVGRGCNLDLCTQRCENRCHNVSVEAGNNGQGSTCRLPLAGSALPLVPLRTGVAGSGVAAPLAGAAGLGGACTVAVETGCAMGAAGAGSSMVAMSCAAGVGGAGACAKTSGGMQTHHGDGVAT